jgi:hypothetical protein
MLRAATAKDNNSCYRKNEIEEAIINRRKTQLSIGIYGINHLINYITFSVGDIYA